MRTPHVRVGGSAALRPNQLVWVQGARRRRPSGRHLSWQELTWGRLTGNLSAARASGSTAEAERDLGISPHAYFYVHAPHPRFSESLLGFLDVHPSVIDEVSVTPFDSGGMVMPKPTPHIPVDAPDTHARRVSIVQARTMTAFEYADPMTTWIPRAFPTISAYSSGARPVIAFAPEVLISNAFDPSAWFWEAKLPARDYLDPPLRPVFMYMKPGHKSRYFTWLDMNPRMSPDELARHYELVESIAVESDDPLAAALDFLR